MNQKTRTRLLPCTKALLLVFFMFSTIPQSFFGTVGAVPTWPSWIPGGAILSNDGFTNDINVTTTIPHLVVNPINGSSNDTRVYVQRWLDTNGRSILFNWIDFEQAAATNLTASIFDVRIDEKYRAGLNNYLENDLGLANKKFYGSTAWDLLVFVFRDVWNDILPSMTANFTLDDFGGYPAIVLEFLVPSGIGSFVLVNMGSRACVALNFRSGILPDESTEMVQATRAFLLSILGPVIHIMHEAYFSQYGIMASGTADGPATTSTGTSNQGDILPHENFVSIVKKMVGMVPKDDFPLIINWNSILFYVLLLSGILLAVLYIYDVIKRKRSAGWTDPSVPVP